MAHNLTAVDVGSDPGAAAAAQFNQGQGTGWGTCRALPGLRGHRPKVNMQGALIGERPWGTFLQAVTACAPPPGAGPVGSQEKNLGQTRKTD